MDALLAGIVANVVADSLAAVAGFAPKALRLFKGTDPDYTISDDGLRRSVADYLASAHGSSMVKCLALLSLEQSSTPTERHIAALRDAFLHEFRAEAALQHLQDEDPSEALLEAGGKAWDLLATDMQEALSLFSNDVRLQNLMHPAAARAPAAVTGQKPRADGKAEESVAPLLPLAVSRRIEMAYAYEAGADTLSVLLEQIRAASQPLYDNLRMPHAKQDYRVPLEDLYVDRTLLSRQPEVIGWERQGRVVVLGSPGAGKSTFVRKILHDVLQSPVSVAPVLLELKEVQLDASMPILLEWLHGQLQQSIQLPIAIEDLDSLLILGQCLVVFDGIDELVNLSRRRDVLDGIQQFCVAYPFVRVLLTSRSHGFEEAKPTAKSMFAVYELPEFNAEQSADYIKKWFGLQGTEVEMLDFSRETSRHTQELIANPLILSLLCSLYQYKGYIPENRPEVYEQCSELLFVRWDKVRRVPVPLRLGNRSRQLIEELADFVFRNQVVQSGIGERQLRKLISVRLRESRQLQEDEADEEAREFLDYCAGRAWLLTQVGTSRRGERLFGFTHRTFLEYFAAKHVARRATTPEDLAAALGPLILSRSSEVVPAIALQSYDASSAYGADLALRFLLFSSPTLTRPMNSNFLPFAVQALEFNVARPGTTREILLPAVRRVPQSSAIARALWRISMDSLRVLIDLCSELKSERDFLIGIVSLDLVRPPSEFLESQDAWDGLLGMAYDSLESQHPDAWQSAPGLAALMFSKGRLLADDLLQHHSVDYILTFGFEHEQHTSQFAADLGGSNAQSLPNYDRNVAALAKALAEGARASADAWLGVAEGFRGNEGHVNPDEMFILLAVVLAGLEADWDTRVAEHFGDLLDMDLGGIYRDRVALMSKPGRATKKFLAAAAALGLNAPHLNVLKNWCLGLQSFLS